MTALRTPELVRAKADTVCVAAVEPAREAAIDEAGAAQIGEHLGHLVEGERLVTHYFASAHPGYKGWRWAVTVTRASRAKTVTVNEVVMLPGDAAIVAPEWVPWSDRVQPGDLRPGDLFPTPADDPRLEPGYTETGAPEDVLEVVEELGLGRERVLSVFGRDDAAERWTAGDFGPASAIAQAVPYKCNGCGYWIRLNDSLGRSFGVCANEMAPGEGRVVAFDYGCGAHSDAVIDLAEPPIADHAFDTTGYDSLELATDDEAVEADAVQTELEATAEPTSDDEVIAGPTSDIEPDAEATSDNEADSEPTSDVEVVAESASGVEATEA